MLYLKVSPLERQGVFSSIYGRCPLCGAEYDNLGNIRHGPICDK